MKRDRYSLNDRSQRSPIDGRNRASSPRTPATVRACGGNGRNGSNSTADPTVGTHGETQHVRRPAKNTMRSSKQGGEGTWSVRKYAMPDGERVPAEWAREVLTYGDKPARMPTRQANRKIDKIDTAIVGHDPADLRKARADARRIAGIESDAEGFRQDAMMRHSIMTTMGAIGTIGNDPVWSDDPTDDDPTDKDD